MLIFTKSYYYNYLQCRFKLKRVSSFSLQEFVERGDVCLRHL